MAALDVVALVVGVAGAVARPRGLPAWAVPCAAAAVVLAAGGLTLDAAGRAVDPLRDPVLFLLAAVPLAVMLDGYGYFAAVAGRLGDRGGAGGLWVLAALVTTVLNLDAAVVLLTPLYVSLARGSGRSPLALAVQPVLLACLASSALPVSNLTNLIAQSATGASAAGFVAHLGLPSLAATCVGYLCYRRWAARQPAAVDGVAATGVAADPAPATAVAVAAGPAGGTRTLLVGSVVVVAVLVGFTAGDAAGIAPWEVALAADVAMLGLLRRVPWRAVPAGTALVALSLGLLAAGAAAHLPVHRVLDGGGGVLTQLRVAGAMAAAANVANNLPALLVALPVLGHRPSPQLWSVLVGVNMGPVLLVTGSLASLLWLESLGRLGVAVRARDFTSVGAAVGLPAALAGLGVHLALVAA